jgi:RNA polymerase sigma-70 factor (ECF subfamily)
VLVTGDYLCVFNNNGMSVNRMFSQKLSKKKLLKEKEFARQIVNSENRFFTYFNSITKSESVANDLVQEMFLTAHRQYVLGLYVEKGKLENYLMKIAVNILKDYFRTNRRHQDGINNYQIDVCSNFGWSEPTCDYLTKTIEETDAELKEHIVSSLLNKKFDFLFLNSDERTILRMRHSNNCSFTKISEDLNVPIATIAFKYKAAIKKIRMAIKKGFVR